MATFESGIVQVNSSVGTVSSMVWNPSNTSVTTFGSLGSVPSTANLTNVIVTNTGANTIYLGSGSIAATSQTGLEVAPGGFAYLQGYSGTVGAAGTIWAQTGVVGQTSSTQAGMASVPSVI